MKVLVFSIFLLSAFTSEAFAFGKVVSESGPYRDFAGTYELVSEETSEPDEKFHCHQTIRFTGEGSTAILLVDGQAKPYAASSLRESASYVDDQGYIGEQGLAFHGGPYHIIADRETPVEGRDAMYISRNPTTNELSLIHAYYPPEIENSSKKRKASKCLYKKVRSEELN